MELGMSDFAKKIAAVLSLGIALVAILLRVKWTWTSYNEYKNRMAACDAAIAQTQTDIQTQKQDLNDVQTDKQEVMANYHDLGQVGTLVAGLQTDWSRYAYSYLVCQEGEKDKYANAMNDVMNRMNDYFEEVPFGWYAYRGTGLTWKCATNYVFYTDVLRTVWLCQYGSVSGMDGMSRGTVFAYATADYSAKNQKFSNVKVHVTSAGESVGISQQSLGSAVYTNPPVTFSVLDGSGRLVGVDGTMDAGSGDVPDDFEELGADSDEYPADDIEDGTADATPSDAGGDGSFDDGFDDEDFWGDEGSGDGGSGGDGSEILF